MPLRRYRLILLAILLGAVALRAINYAALADGPCLLAHEVSDMAVFEDWAKTIAEGDYLTDRSLHPLHNWHREVAARYLRKHPNEIDGAILDVLSPQRQGEEFKKLWDKWYGGKRFHQEPLYPYLLALVRWGMGIDPIIVHALQMLVGIASLFLLCSVTRIYFGEHSALLATGLAALCAPFVFFELYTLRATWIVFASLVLLRAAEATRRAGSPRSWLLFGICTGLVFTLKAPLGVFGVVAALILAMHWRGKLTAALPLLGWFATGSCLAFSPVIIRNLIVGTGALESSSVGAVTFANSNAAGYSGFGWNVDHESLERIMGVSDGALWTTVTETLGSHPDVGSYLALLWRKFCLVWHWLEIPNNVDLSYVTRHSDVLGFMPVTFAVAAALAAIGIGVHFRRRTLPLTLVALIVLTVLQLTVFYTLARFRLPLLIGLMPFAGAGIACLWEWITDRDLRPLVAWVAISAGLVALIRRPPPAEANAMDLAPYSNSYNHFYLPRWRAATAAKDWRAAAELMRRAIETRPPYLGELGIDKPRCRLPVNESEFLLSRIFADTYAMYGDSLRALEDGPAAAKAETRSRELNAVAERIEELKRLNR